MEEILPDSTTERGDSHDMQQRKATGPPLLRPGSTMGKIFDSKASNFDGKEIEKGVGVVGGRVLK